MAEGPSVINVTKTYLPPLEEYVAYLERIWESNQVTNNGPLVRELEAKLKEFLGVKHLFFVSNGTIALQIAIKALDLQGEIITTPFSYVATTSSIVWEGCTPVFVDIDPETLNINPNLIEAAITPRTTAILAVHVYGHPCDVERIQAIADRHGLKVIYDAAHAFGVYYKGDSLLKNGDISTLSFHATKLFHTGEGGALVTDDDALAHRIAYMRNFGHRGQEDFWGLGINGKNSELHAAMGLCLLPKLPEIIMKRGVISREYDRSLDWYFLFKPVISEQTIYNYSYYPILFQSEQQLVKARETLHNYKIYPRRYFYPSLDTLGYVHSSIRTVSEEIAKRVLCLPLYMEMNKMDVYRIVESIKESIIC